MNSKTELMLALAVYSEMNIHFLVSEDTFEIDDQDKDYIYDEDYINVLNRQVDEICKHNSFPQENIEKLKSIIEKYKICLSNSNEDNTSIIKRYDDILSKLDSITYFSFDYLYLDFRTKYLGLNCIDKLVGINFNDMCESITYDYYVLVSIIDGNFNENISEQNYVLAIKKYLHDYANLFKIYLFRKNTLNILTNIIRNNTSISLVREAKKLFKQIFIGDNIKLDIDAYKSYYYYHLIVGMVTNSNFNELFENLDEKDIMSILFIDNLMKVVEELDNNLNKNAVSNLKEIVYYIDRHYKDYYEGSMLSEINDMKCKLNVQTKDNSEFYLINIYLKETLKERIKYKMYSLQHVLNHNKHNLDFYNLIEEILYDEYNFSRILKSYFVSEEQFQNEYYEDFINDNNYIKNIRKLFKLYPAVFIDNSAYDRTKQIIDEKIRLQEEYGAITKSYKKEHQKILEKMGRYNGQ